MYYGNRYINSTVIKVELQKQRVAGVSQKTDRYTKSVQNIADFHEKCIILRFGISHLISFIIM